MDKTKQRGEIIRIGLAVTRAAKAIEESKGIHTDHEILKELKARLESLPEEVPAND